MSVGRTEVEVKLGNAPDQSPFTAVIDGVHHYYFQQKKEMDFFVEGYMACWNDHFGRD